MWIIRCFSIMLNMGNLYLVATPIGNLGDITLRAVAILKEVELVLAEDTRVTQKLLNHLGLNKELWRYDEHVHSRTAPRLLAFLKEGKNAALVTDAGTPGLADPGGWLVRWLREKEGYRVGIMVLPGPSALTAAIALSGQGGQGFVFFGYPPHRKGRKTFFESIRQNSLRPAVLYESPHRFLKTLADIERALGRETRLFIAREMTKKHEETLEGTPEEVRRHFMTKGVRGEFVLIIC